MRRAAALVVVCLLAGSALAEQLHVALVRHVRCEAHGEWIHGEAHPAAAPSAGDTVASAPELDGGHDHEHCAAPRGLTACVTLPAQWSVPTGFTFTPPARPRTEPRAATIPLWLLAPKSSPPVS